MAHRISTCNRYEKEWLNRIVPIKIDNRLIQLDLWEKYTHDWKANGNYIRFKRASQKFGTEMPNQNLCLFYLGCDMIVINLDMEYKLG